MKIYISILRGINVSGKKLIKMDELKSLYVNLGFTDVKTYIQSGNVIFKSDSTDSKILVEKIAKKITDLFGFEVPVLIKEIEEIREIIVSNPFLKMTNYDHSFFHVTMLSSEPLERDFDKISENKYKPDEFILNKGNIYLYCPNGYGRTKLTNTFFENKLKLSATTRNWKTINELLRIASE